MEIGTPQKVIEAEPLETPFKKDTPAPAPAKTPAPTPVKTPEKVPA